VALLLAAVELSLPLGILGTLDGALRSVDDEVELSLPLGIFGTLNGALRSVDDETEESA